MLASEQVDTRAIERGHEYEASTRWMLGGRNAMQIAGVRWVQAPRQVPVIPFVMTFDVHGSADLSTILDRARGAHQHHRTSGHRASFEMPTPEGDWSCGWSRGRRLIIFSGHLNPEDQENRRFFHNRALRQAGFIDVAKVVGEAIWEDLGLDARDTEIVDLISSDGFFRIHLTREKAPAVAEA